MILDEANNLISPEEIGRDNLITSVEIGGDNLITPEEIGRDNLITHVEIGGFTLQLLNQRQAKMKSLNGPNHNVDCR